MRKFFKYVAILGAIGLLWNFIKGAAGGNGYNESTFNTIGIITFISLILWLFYPKTEDEKDELESKNLLEDHHFKMILHKVQTDNDFKWLDKDIQIEEANRLFENKYGYKFNDPFNAY